MTFKDGMRAALPVVLGYLEGGDPSSNIRKPAR
jgi:hypothetical protein